jgi:hypothetical protein
MNAIFMPAASAVKLKNLQKSPLGLHFLAVGMNFSVTRL